MKITGLSTITVDAFRTNWTFVKVHADNGLHGVGEAILETRSQTIVAAIQELERNLVGRDADDIEGWYHDAHRESYYRRGAVLTSALSAVEIALWDLKGKTYGLPVYKLLGGPVRDKIRCYANNWFTGARKPEEFARKAQETVAMGFTALKWDPFGTAYMELSRKEFNRVMQCIEAVAAAVGDDVDLLIECHGRLNVPTAVRVARELARFNVLFFEEPVPPECASALADVRARSPVPIAAGERMYNRVQFLDYFQQGCLDVAQPDVIHVGGISECQKVAAMAEPLCLSVSPHNPNGPVANAATLALAAILPNFGLLETVVVDVPWRADVCKEDLWMEDGWMGIPDAPGLGVEIDEDECKKHPYAPHELRHYNGNLTLTRPADAGPYYRTSRRDDREKR